MTIFGIHSYRSCIQHENDKCLKHIVFKKTALLSTFCKEYDMDFEIKKLLLNIFDILNLSAKAYIFYDLIKSEIEYDKLENSKEPVIDDTVFILDKI